MDLGLNPNFCAFVILGDDLRKSTPVSPGVGRSGDWQRGREPLGAQRLGWPFGVCHQGGLMFLLQTLHLSCPWGGAK